MLILADGEDVQDLVPDDDRIRLIIIEEGRTVGEKRNFGAGLSRGEVIIHWDDDDYSAPGRLADQLDRLVQSGKAVTGYSSMYFTDGARWWIYEGIGNFAVGTSLCYRKDWWQDHPFPEKQVGEDTDFVSAAKRYDQLVSAPAGDLMVASVHASNTSPRQLTGVQWKLLPDFAGIPGVEIIP